jgi:hypothetical protein
MIVRKYPVGTPGIPWSENEINHWRSLQRRQRDYRKDVLDRILLMENKYEIIVYDHLFCGTGSYPLFILRSRKYDPLLPSALITGGVHGYETSGVMGALEFLEKCGRDEYANMNLWVAPCVSPWAYEHISRWNYDAVDPNRSFRPCSSAKESAALIKFVNGVSGSFILHVDLHETTNSDEEEFRPSLAARDGRAYEPEITPDGFYLVDDSANPQPAFQRAIIEAVERVTHITDPDQYGDIIGSRVVAHGVIEYPLAELGLCTSITGARFTTTTEVYPDSARTTAEICNRAQVVAICAALDFVACA